MPSFRADHSPSVTGLLAHPRGARAALSAAVVRLGARGWLELRERPGKKIGLSLKKAPHADALSTTELWLLSAIRRWAKDSAAPSLQEWKEALIKQAAEEGATPQSALSAFFSPSEKTAKARDFARLFDGYPDPEGELPKTREEWDERLAYATALGLAEEFLYRAREVNEYYMRHYQGVVVTLCTPGWFVEDPDSDRARFAYLTEQLAPLLSRWNWASLEPL